MTANHLDLAPDDPLADREELLVYRRWFQHLHARDTNHGPNIQAILSEAAAAVGRADPERYPEIIDKLALMLVTVAKERQENEARRGAGEVDHFPRPKHPEDAWFTSAYGHRIYLLEPEKTEIDERDLVVHLGRHCRCGGAVGTNVMQHLALAVLLARDILKASPVFVAQVALHDAPEAFLLDLPKPLKRLLPAYVAIEDRWLTRFHTHFRVRMPTPEEHNMRSLIDGRALLIEAYYADHPNFRYFERQFGGELCVEELDAGQQVYRSLQAPSMEPDFLWTQIVRPAIYAGREGD